MKKIKWGILLGIFAFFFFGAFNNAHAAIAYDASTSTFANPASSLTFPHTVTGNHPILFVSTMINATSNTFSAVSYGGIALTKINEILQTSQDYFISLWYLTAPPTGTNNIVATSTVSAYTEAMSISYTGASKYQSDIIANSTSSQRASVTTSTLSATTAKNNSWVIMDAIATQSLSAGANTTERQEVTTNNPGHTLNDSNAPVSPPGSRALNVTLAGSGTVAHIVAPFAPVNPSRRYILN